MWGPGNCEDIWHYLVIDMRLSFGTYLSSQKATTHTNTHLEVILHSLERRKLEKCVEIHMYIERTCEINTSIKRSTPEISTLFCTPCRSIVHCFSAVFCLFIWICNSLHYFPCSWPGSGLSLRPLDITETIQAIASTMSGNIFLKNTWRKEINCSISIDLNNMSSGWEHQIPSERSINSHTTDVFWHTAVCSPRYSVLPLR